MSFSTNNPNGNGEFQTRNVQTQRRTVVVPAFRPEFVRSVRMHPMVAAVVAGVALIGLVIFALSIKPVYQAEALVQEEPGAAKLIGDATAGSFDAVRYDSFLQQQTQIILRPDIIASALEALPPATWREYGPSVPIAASNIASLLKVARVTTSYQLAIDLKGSDPVETAAIVNAITSAYLAEAHKATLSESDQRAQLLEEERGRIENELQTARAEQTALGISLGVANPTGETGNPFDANLAAVRTELVEARAAHDVAAAQLASLTGQGNGRNSALAAAADELIAGDSGLSSMKATISQRRAILAGNMAGMTPSNPVYKQDQEEVAELDRKLDDTTVELRDKAERHLQDKLRGDLERTGDIEARLNASLARQTVAATGAAPKLQRASELAADILRLETRHAAVEDALHSLQLEASGPAVAHLFLAAPPPASPERSRRRLILLAALPLALLLGAFAAAFVRKRDRRIYNGQDVEDTLGFPAIALLPARADVSDGVLDEHVLRLAGGIESAYRSGGARTFVLTAVSLHTDIGPLASMLQRKFEQMGMDVVLASTSDLMRPPQPGKPGDEADDRRDTDHAELIPAGFAKSGFVGANLDRIQANHSLVLIEAAPLVNSAETEYVARASSATILIVESAVTTRDEVLRAAGLLQRLSVNGIGAVLEELQLRYADVPYREAIEALEHRRAGQSASHQTVTARVRDEAEIVHDTPVPIEAVSLGVPLVEQVVAPEVTTATEEPLTEVHPIEAPSLEAPWIASSLPEVHSPPITAATAETMEMHVPESHIDEQPSIDVHVVQIDAAQVRTSAVQETGKQTAEVVYAIPAVLPVAHSAEVAPEPVAEPEEVPVSALHEAVSQAVPLVLITRVAGETEADAVTVAAAELELEQAQIPAPPMAEPILAFPAQEPVLMHAAEERPHEKMASKQRAPVVNGASFGDAGMTPTRTWWQRLLRRDQEPAYSIVPDDDGEEVEANSSSGGRIVQLPERRGYDIPPERFDQISRSRPAAQPQGEVLKPHVPTRFTLEPEEPALPSHAALHLVADHGLPGVLDEDYPVMNHERHTPQAAPQEAEYPKAVDPELLKDEPIFSPVVSEALQPVSAMPDEVLHGAVEHKTSVGEAIEQDPLHSELPPPVPDLETVVASAPPAPAPPRPLSFHELTALLAEHTPVSHEVLVERPVTDDPAIAEGHVEHVEETAATEHPQAAIVAPETDPASPPALHLVPEAAAHAEPAPVVEEAIEPEVATAETAPPSAPAPRETPISDGDYYHRPSNPNLSRWDPIPPLRPNESDWRDRISSQSHRIAAGDPWASTSAARQEPHLRDAWSRPAQSESHDREVSLTRQWGLLSRFQQASGLASGPHRVAEASEDSRSEHIQNGSNNGSH